MPNEIDRASAAGKRFAAFISYSHRDEEFGDWLHKRLESYQVPSALVGRQSSVGQIGKRLGKVFRDRVDLSAAHDLGREIREGLEQSDALIVLCSPRSSGSKYVQDEILTFKKLGKGQRIFAAIIDGEPHAAGRPGYTAADECFPSSLIFALNHDGSLSSQLELTEPIAADFRDGKDGRENGSLKLIAGLLDVGLDELLQRERQAERRRRVTAYGIASVTATLAVIAVVAGVFAFLQTQEANRQRVVADTEREAAVQAQISSEITADEQRQIAEGIRRLMEIEWRSGTDGAPPGLGPRAQRYRQLSELMASIQDTATRRREDALGDFRQSLAAANPNDVSRIELSLSIVRAWQELAEVRERLAGDSVLRFAQGRDELFPGLRRYEQVDQFLQMSGNSGSLPILLNFFARFSTLGPAGEIDRDLIAPLLEVPASAGNSSPQWWADNFFSPLAAGYDSQSRPPPENLRAALCGLAWLGVSASDWPLTTQEYERCRPATPN